MAVAKKSKPARERARRELIELVDGELLELELIQGLAGDLPLTAEQRSELKRRRRRRGRAFYTDVLYGISHEFFLPEEAEGIWKGLLRHQLSLRDQLGRDVGVMVAALDYLTNVRGVIERSSLIRPRKLATVVEVALRDGLTGVLTRSTLLAKLDTEIARADRYGDVVSLLMLDLDDFKRVNDQQGHVVGDRVLESVGAAIQRVARDTDVAGRYGGEEFCVIMPRTTVREALVLGERLRREIERVLAKRTGSTGSIGIAAYPRDALTARELIRAADRALYQSKAAGKNRVTVYEVRRPGRRRAAKK